MHRVYQADRPGARDEPRSFPARYEVCASGVSAWISTVRVSVSAYMHTNDRIAMAST